MSALASKFVLLWKAAGGPELTPEYKFHPTRKWRFDFALPDYKLAIEIDGGAFLPFGGRHGRGMGMVKDCEKYRAAADLGWRVWRFSPKCITTDFIKTTAQTFKLTMKRSSK
jgi:very-short-patch-repair endonuclease